MAKPFSSMARAAHQFTPSLPGKIQLTATAANLDGQLAQTTAFLKVRDPSDTAAPLVPLDATLSGVKLDRPHQHRRLHRRQQPRFLDPLVRPARFRQLHHVGPRQRLRHGHTCHLRSHVRPERHVPPQPNGHRHQRPNHHQRSRPGSEYRDEAKSVSDFNYRPDGATGRRTNNLGPHL